MTYEKYEKRVAAIDKWFDEYIKETFLDLDAILYKFNSVHITTSLKFDKSSIT